MPRGRCLCGAVVCETSAPPRTVLDCHCALCRRAVGASPVTWAVYPKAAVAIEGTPTWYASSSHARRGFCAACGASLFFESARAPEEIDICVAVFSDADAPRPSCNTWSLDRAPWAHLDGQLPCHVGDSDSPMLEAAHRVRVERPEDHARIRGIHQLAFGRDDEADLVERLRQADALRLGCLIELEGEVVGHVAFSPVVVEGADGGAPTEALGLAPLAVLPEVQKRGLGTRLVLHALAGLRGARQQAVFVLGHPDYYTRFGFEPAAARGLAWEHPAPEGAFMCLELEPGALAGVVGSVRYHPAFGAPATPEAS